MSSLAAADYLKLNPQVTALQVQLKQQTDASTSLSEELDAAKSRLHSLENQLEERNSSIRSLTEEVERLRPDVGVGSVCFSMDRCFC